MGNDSRNRSSILWKIAYKGLAMTFLKSIWRKLFPVKDEMVLVQEYWHRDGAKAFEIGDDLWQAYDPSEDPEKLLRGEVESYFD